MFSARITGYALPLCALLLGSMIALDTHAADNDSATLQSRPTLTDAWLAMDRLPQGRAYYLLETDQERLEQQGRQLRHELAELIGKAGQAGQNRRWQGLVQWQLKLNQPATLRTLASADLASLLENPRSAPFLDTLASYGACTPADWIDVWTPNGVIRLDWQEGSRLANTLDRLPKDAYRGADTATVVTPRGSTYQRGVAAWNLQDVALAPGSRIVFSLPSDNVSARWVNKNLPKYLAARMPGNDCTRDSMKPDDVSAP
ncbi:capsule biosynthesis GfcC family protein [Pistricoccus aurantiacus]|uniref:capsule biosynthesis GfcC family protein n=1 Tax=Pistricoccus aurantiacus TaxID=1883414 RepID=UPI003632C7A3